MSPSRSIHYYGNVPNHPCVPLPMCPISHVVYCPCVPLSYSHVDLERNMPHCPYTPSLLFPITMCPITLLLVLMCPIAHGSHCSCGLLSIHPITLLPCRSRISRATLSICPITHIPMSNGHTGDGAAKCQMMSSCQKLE